MASCHHKTACHSPNAQGPPPKSACPIAPSMPYHFWLLPFLPIQIWQSNILLLLNPTKETTRSMMKSMQLELYQCLIPQMEKLRQSSYNYLGRASWIWLISIDRWKRGSVTEQGSCVKPPQSWTNHPIAYRSFSWLHACQITQCGFLGPANKKEISRKGLTEKY